MASATIGSLRVDLGIDTTAFSTGLRTAGSKLSAFGGVLKKAILPLPAIGATGAVALGASVKSTVNAADEMSKAAQKFGVPIEELSRLKYAADLSDVSLQALGTGLGRLSQLMADAAGGSESAVATFDGLGIAFQNADGSLRASSDVLNDIAAAFAGMEDGPAKTAAAMDLLGRGGKEMIPLLNGGSEALRQMKAEADSFGQVFTAETGASAEVFNDNLTRLGGTFRNMAADLTERLLPHLAAFSTWLVTNGPAIADVIVKFVEFGAKMVEVGQVIAQGIKTGGDALVAFVQQVVSAGQSIATFATEAIATVQAFAADLAATFNGLRERFVQIGRDVIAGLWDGMKERWEVLKASIASIPEGIVGIFNRVLDRHSPSQVFAEIGRDLMAGLSQGLMSMEGRVQGEAGRFASSLSSTFAGVLTGATDFREALRSILADVGGGLIQSDVGTVFSGLGQKIPGFARGTNFAPGGLAWVGERGPELMRVPRGSQVIPHDLSRDLLGGGVRDLRISVDVSGARGNAEIQVRTAVQKSAREAA